MKKIRVDIYDISAVAGAGIFIYGIAEISITAAILVTGILLLAFGIAGARNKSRSG